jgi:hypothetical protein
MTRAVVLALLCSSVLLAVFGAGAPATAASTTGGGDIYVYGHSWVTGYGLSDVTQGYPWLVASDRGATLHPRGVNGTMVHQVAGRLYGPGEGSWRAGSGGDVLIQAVTNTARDLGIDTAALATTRNDLRIMAATISASRRIEDSSASHRYHGSWRVADVGSASGGSIHETTHNDAYVEFRAVGGEYISLRGASGDGIRVRLSDRTAGHTVTHISTGHRVYRPWSDHGIPLVYRLPEAMAGHTIRLTKQSGTGAFMFDARLPQQAHPGTVVLVKEPYLADYSLSTAHPNGSNEVMDAFNHVIDGVAAEFPNAVVVDPNADGWDPRTMLLPRSTHPNPAGHRFLADLVEKALDG